MTTRINFDVELKQPFDFLVEHYAGNSVALAFIALTLKHPEGKITLFFDEAGFVEFQRQLISTITGSQIPIPSPQAPAQEEVK